MFQTELNSRPLSNLLSRWTVVQSSVSMPRHANNDSVILEAALVGLEYQKSEIDRRMTEIQKELRSERPLGSQVQPTGQKHTRSAAVRKRMAAAQRKRWAGLKKAKEMPAKKRTLSATARKRIAEATRKRWAAFRANKAAVKVPAKKAAVKKISRKAAAPPTAKAETLVS